MDYFLLHKKVLHNLFESNLNFDLHLPFHGFQDELVRELNLLSIQIHLILPRVIITAPVQQRPIWSQDWWPGCILLNGSISTENKLEKLAVQFLKNQDRIGVYHQTEVSKLADRIQKKIKSLAVKRIKYSNPHPFDFKFYSWTVVSDFIIFCKNPSQRFPLGWHEFEENKIAPPNRAYLKLWELFAVYNLAPDANAQVLEIGASPGGWSWVLSDIIENIYTIDRAPLDLKLNAKTNINHKIGDAFKLDPKNFEKCTWFFSDIICTPEKMYETVHFWLENSSIRNFVCTVKFKGSCDFDILKRFELIPNSKIIHLYQNKNEVTWIKLDESISSRLKF